MNRSFSPALLSCALASTFLWGCATSSRTSEQIPLPPAASAAPPASPTATPLEARPFRKPPPLQSVVQKTPNTPLVTLRVVFRTGSIDDPKGKEGLTALTVALMEGGGTRSLSSSELLAALYPMAAELSATTDKEQTTFAGRVHNDHLDRFLAIFTDLMLEPRFDPRELDRLRSDALNNIRNGLRNQSDEELGKVALDALLYPNHPYGHFIGGTVEGLQAITLDDVKAHWRRVFTQDRAVMGLAGAVDVALEHKVKARLSALPATGAPEAELPPVTPNPKAVALLEKDSLSTAISLGYPYRLRRGDPDFFPVALALSYLGEHRQLHGVLFRELRERRGLNYGNYAYPEHFAQEGWSTLPRTQVARRCQDLSLWLRPVEPQNAVFASRAAIHYFDALVKEGIPADAFEQVRGFLQGYTRLWEQTDARRLGYAIDDLFYGTPDYLEKYRQALGTLTREQVHAAVKRHLDSSRFEWVYVAKDTAGLKTKLASGAPSPIQYPTPKDLSVLQEDAAIVAQPLPQHSAKMRVAEAQQFMERATP